MSWHVTVTLNEERSTIISVVVLVWDHSHRLCNYHPKNWKVPGSVFGIKKKKNPHFFEIAWKLADPFSHLF